MSLPKYEIPLMVNTTVNNKDWYKFFTSLAPVPGAYNATFQSGQIQYQGQNGPIGNNNLIFGLNLPNPSGTPGPGLLLGSGSTPVSFWIIQDQAFTPTQNGNNLGITAGETQGSGTANGGSLLAIGGGSFGGTGGTATWQGGTSANGTGGEAILAGGNSTNGGVPGDAFVIGGAGMAPSQGANVHLIMTQVAGISGDVRIRVNSTILMQFLSTGEIFLTKSGTGSGLAGQALVSAGVGAPAQWQAGYTGTITTAALTGGGTTGSMTFNQGILISQVAAT